jgi:hypothetical protein
MAAMIADSNRIIPSSGHAERRFRAGSGLAERKAGGMQIVLICAAPLG